MDKLKYYCYHFYLLHEQMKDIVELMATIQKSNLATEWIAKAWYFNSQMLVLKYHNYYKDWKQAKDLVDPKIAEVMKEFFHKVEENWTDLDKYRNEIISHAFGRPIGTSLNNKQSIFSLGTWITYEIPIESHDYIRLYFHIKNMTMFLKGQFPEFWKEFEDGTFPVLPS